MVVFFLDVFIIKDQSKQSTNNKKKLQFSSQTEKLQLFWLTGWVPITNISLFGYPAFR
jgi:hypothetical protein